MEPEPSQEEYSLTARTIQEVSGGRNYLIDISKLDIRSVVEIRRLIRDLDERCLEARRKAIPYASAPR